MKNDPLYNLKYPIGEFTKPNDITSDSIREWVLDLQSFPEKLKEHVCGLTDKELNYKYRPDGWTIKQVIHHCADSHMNSIMRFKLALTEEAPIIKPYFEDRWAKLNDYETSVEASVNILSGIHQKFGVIFNNLSEKELKRTFTHPEHGREFSIEETIGTYAWHSNHHLAHIEQALLSKGKYN